MAYFFFPSLFSLLHNSAACVLFLFLLIKKISQLNRGSFHEDAMAAAAPPWHLPNYDISVIINPVAFLGEFLCALFNTLNGYIISIVVVEYNFTPWCEEKWLKVAQKIKLSRDWVCVCVCDELNILLSLKKSAPEWLFFFYFFSKCMTWRRPLSWLAEL